MIVEYYPLEGEEGRIEKFIRKDLDKRKDLKKLVETFLDKLRISVSLQVFIDTEQISFLETVSMNKGKGETRLGELRIPKTKNGGVVRIYFIVNTFNSSKVLLLDGEIKHKTKPKIIGLVKSIVNKISY